MRDPLEEGAEKLEKREYSSSLYHLRNLCYQARKKSEEQQAPRMKAKDRISHFSPRTCYPIYSQLCLIVVILTKA